MQTVAAWVDDDMVVSAKLATRVMASDVVVTEIWMAGQMSAWIVHIRIADKIIVQAFL